MLETLVTIVHVVVAIFMILVVLFQGGNSGGVGAAFGGGNSQGVMGATGGQSFLGKVTYGAAAVFMATTLSLTVMQGGSGSTGLRDQLKEEAAATTTGAEEAEVKTPADATKDKADQ